MKAIVESAMMRHERGEITWEQFLAVLKWATEF